MKFLTNEIIEKFKLYLIEEEKSNNTIEKYIRDVFAFANFIGNDEITKEKVLMYKKSLIDNGYKHRSINSMIAAINALFAFVGRGDLKVKALKIQRQAFCDDDKELTKDEYFRLVETASKKQNERLSLIIQTICGTGIRVSELQFITVEAVKSGQATVSLKGKTRRIFIVKELKKKLLAYAKEQRIKSGCVFVTRNGKPMSRTNIWREMKKLCEDANVNPNKVFPHNLRHLFARSFYNIEKDIAKLANILGHSSVETTMIYLTTTTNEHIKRMEKMRLVI